MPGDEALTRDVVVQLPAGLHLRPISAIARLVNTSDAQLTIRKGNAAANGTSPLELMSLAAAPGDALTLEATGPNAEDLLEAVAACIEGRSSDD